MKPSRAMITGELSWATIAVVTALEVILSWDAAPTRMFDMTTMGIWPGLIGVIMGFLGAAAWMFAAVAYIERTRPCDSIEQIEAARTRGKVAFCLALMWTSLLYAAIQHPVDNPSLVLLAFFGAAFNLWFWGESRRVQRDYRRQTGAFDVRPAR